MKQLFSANLEPLAFTIRNINQQELYLFNNEILVICIGCYRFCQKQEDGCWLSNYYHLGEQKYVICSPNFLMKGGFCTKCVDFCQTCDSDGSCLTCQEGSYFDPVKKECRFCDLNCLTCQYSADK